MPSLLDVITASVEIIGRKVEGLAQVEIYDGQFTREGPTRSFVRPPSCFISCLGGPIDADPGTSEVDINARFMAFVVVRSQSPTRTRAHHVVRLVESICLVVRLNRWGLKKVGAAVIRTIKNDYSQQFDSMGLHVWRVEWDQKVRIGKPVEGDGILPCVVLLGMVPDVGFGHEDDYVEVFRDEERCPLPVVVDLKFADVQSAAVADNARLGQAPFVCAPANAQAAADSMVIVQEAAIPQTGLVMHIDGQANTLI